jgi:hypothetical protein
LVSFSACLAFCTACSALSTAAWAVGTLPADDAPAPEEPPLPPPDPPPPPPPVVDEPDDVDGAADRDGTGVAGGALGAVALGEDWDAFDVDFDFDFDFAELDVEDPESPELDDPEPLGADDPELDVVDPGVDGEPDELDGADPVVVVVVVLVV